MAVPDYGRAAEISAAKQDTETSLRRVRLHFDFLVQLCWYPLIQNAACRDDVAQDGRFKTT